MDSAAGTALAGERSGAPGENRQTFLIILALITAIAPHVPGLPLWITVWCLVMWGYRLLVLRTRWPLPNAPVRHFLAFLGVFGLMMTFRMRIGADGFVGLMALMAAIKPFEMPTHRHRMITLLLTYFIIITSLFRSESLWVMVYMLFCVFVTTTALISINAPEFDNTRCRRLAGTILAQAVPLAAVLFLIFPRLPDSLFGLKNPATAQTGLSETLAPGSVSKLSENQDPAFMALFDPQPPRPDQLYWRTIVFQTFDGRAWRPVKGPWPRQTRSVPGKSGDRKQGDIVQTIILAEHGGQRLPALDRPLEGPPWAVKREDSTLVSLKRMGKKGRYRAISRLSAHGGSIEEVSDSAGAALLNRQIIAGNGPMNPKAVQLAQEFSRSSDSVKQTVEAALAFFRYQGFSYIKTPPLLGNHPMDDFLFSTRKGYCEHFAGALAFLLNHAGVPARVVGGYLGGEFNPFGGFLIVRLSYAHAWVEYFDQSAGWVRVDPTSVVAPERITTNPDGSAMGNIADRGTLPLLSRIKFAVQALNLEWEAWFTGYSALEQRAWLKAAGLLKQISPGLLLGGSTLGGILIFSLVMGWLVTGRRKVRDPVAEAFQKLLKKLSREGLERGAGQGPCDFFRSCIKKRPDMAEELQDMMDLYISIRYKKACPESASSRFRSRVKRFNPGKRKT